MLKTLRFKCAMFDGGSLNTLIKMGKFRFRHGKVKELHVRRHCIETSSSTSRSKSRYALPTANELAFLFFSSIFPDCNRLYNANAPVVNSSGWLRCQGTRSGADRNADHKAKVARMSSSASQKKEFATHPWRGGTVSPWNDASWRERGLAPSSSTRTELVLLLLVVAPFEDLVPMNGCEQLTILGAGYPSRKEPQ